MISKIRFPLLLMLVAALVSLTVAQSPGPGGADIDDDDDEEVVDDDDVDGGVVVIIDEDDDDDDVVVLDPENFCLNVPIDANADEVDEALSAILQDFIDNNNVSGLSVLNNNLSTISASPALNNAEVLALITNLINSGLLDLSTINQVIRGQLVDLRIGLCQSGTSGDFNAELLEDEVIAEIIEFTDALAEIISNALIIVFQQTPEDLAYLLNLLSTATRSNRLNIAEANPLDVGSFAKPLNQTATPQYVYDVTTLVGGAAGLISYVYNENNFSLFSEGIFPVGASTVSYEDALSGALITNPLRAESVIFADFGVVDAAGTPVEVSGEEPFFQIIELSDVLPADRILVERYDDVLGDYVTLPLLGDRTTNTILYSTYEIDALNYSFLSVLELQGTSGLLQGTANPEVLRGSTGADELLGGAGNDILLGFEGNDTIRGEAGNDFLRGGAGDDFISGGPGNDVFVLSAGNDSFEAAGGTDQLYGPDLRLLMTLGSGGDCESIDITRGVDGSIAGVCGSGIAHTFRESDFAPFVPFGN